MFTVRCSFNGSGNSEGEIFADFFALPDTVLKASYPTAEMAFAVMQYHYRGPFEGVGVDWDIIDEAGNVVQVDDPVYWSHSRIAEAVGSLR